LFASLFIPVYYKIPVNKQKAHPQAVNKKVRIQYDLMQNSVKLIIINVYIEVSKM